MIDLFTQLATIRWASIGIGWQCRGRKLPLDQCLANVGKLGIKPTITAKIYCWANVVLAQR